MQNDKRNEKGQTLAEFLAEYDLKKYDRPSVTLDNVIFARDEEGLSVLLIRRRNHPFIGDLAFPGGFLEMDEDLPEGAARELYEETGVTGIEPVELGVYGRPGRDPRGRIITVAFVSRLPEGARPKAGDDAKDAGMWRISVIPDEKSIVLTSEQTGESVRVPYEFDRGKAAFIPAEGIAGDHGQILADALRAAGLING